jgi:hypothetical protein
MVSLQPVKSGLDTRREITKQLDISPEIADAEKKRRIERNTVRFFARSGPDGRRILCKYSRVTACSAAPILSLRYLRSHLRALSCRDRQCGSSGWSGALLALPARLADFDEVPVWVAHVAAYLTDVVFGLGEKHGALLAPLIIARMYIGDADVHEARRFVGIGRGVE